MASTSSFIENSGFSDKECVSPPPNQTGETEAGTGGTEGTEAGTGESTESDFKKGFDTVVDIFTRAISFQVKPIITLYQNLILVLGSKVNQNLMLLLIPLYLEKP